MKGITAGVAYDTCACRGSFVQVLLELAGPAGAAAQLRRTNGRGEGVVHVAAGGGSADTLAVLLRHAGAAGATLLGVQGGDGRTAAQYATSDAVRGVIAEAEERAAGVSRELMELLAEGKVGAEGWHGAWSWHVAVACVMPHVSTIGVAHGGREGGPEGRCIACPGCHHRYQL